MGHVTQLGLGPQHATELATRQFEFQSCTLNKRDNLIRTNGIRGQRAPIGDHTQKGTYTVNGNVVLLPRPDDLDFLLPYILGGTEVADVFDLAESLPDLVATIDKDLYVETYRGLKVAQAIFRSSQGQPLQLELQLEGRIQDNPAAAGTFPSISATLSEKLPYVHHHASWTFDDTDIQINDLVLTINNGLELEHFNNSQTRTSLPEGEQNVTLAFTTEHNAVFDDHLREIAARGVSAAQLVYNNGTDSMTVDFGLLQKPQTPVDISGMQSIRPQVTLQAFTDLANAVPLIQFTNTNTTA
ncbi:hypothetical protein C5Y96_10785 [Blastopirellula marina]|uniref:Uncharacterized protein n=2 Tax=Pirellulales TaxID=2691354 RepID=A0A2S8FMB2_9BACT|nr:hypothetical protein C5Y96_10785 [Blastopirellula marina]RCS52418.1 hypothetical protein DTL36_10795 [Bremerella cremea]